MHDYRHLTATELLTFFVRITGGYINKGRDARLLSYFMDNHNLRSTQIMTAMYDFKMRTSTKDIPTFLETIDLETDLLEEEAELVLYMAGNMDAPAFYRHYLDLRDMDMESAVMEQSFMQAREELESWLDDALNRPASLSNRGRAAGKHHHRRSTN